SDPVKLCPLLRAHCYRANKCRNGRCTAEQRDNVPSIHGDSNFAVSAAAAGSPFIEHQSTDTAARCSDVRCSSIEFHFPSSLPLLKAGLGGLERTRRHCSHSLRCC